MEQIQSVTSRKEVIDSACISAHEQKFYVKRLKLSHFKRFDSLDLRFADGFQIIIGPNEKGKSTIVDAIIAGLFFNPESKASYITQHQSWGSDQLYSLELEMVMHGKEFLLKKDFENKYFQLKAIDGSEHYDTFEKGQPVIDNAIGFSSSLVFETSGCIKQGMMSDIQTKINKKEVASSLEGAVTSIDVHISASDVIKRIERTIRSINKGLKTITRDPGPLREICDSIQSHTHQLQQQKKAFDLLQSSYVELEEIKKLSRTVNKKLQSKKQLLEKIIAQRSSKSNIKKLEKEYIRFQQQLEQYEKLEHEITFLTDKLKNYPSHTVEDYHNAQKQILEIQSTLKVYQDQAKEISHGKETLQRGALWASLGFGILGLLGFVIDPFFYILFLLAIGSFAVYGILRAKQRSYERVDKETSLRTRFQKILQTFDSNTVKEFLEKKKEFESVLQKRNDLQSEIRGFERKGSKKELEKQKQDLILALDQEKQFFRENGGDGKTGITLSDSEIITLKHEVEELQLQSDHLRQETTAKKAVINSSRVDPDNMIRLEEELHVFQDREHEIKSKLRVLEITKKYIDMARTSTLENTSVRLQKYLKKHLPFITNARYKDVEVNSQMEIQVFSKERNDYLEPETHLSHGTIDQIYLIARFGLHELFSGGRHSIMILDDPFVHFDKERRLNALELLQTMAQENQIILLTHNREYASLPEVIQL